MNHFSGDCEEDMTYNAENERNNTLSDSTLVVIAAMVCTIGFFILLIISIKFFKKCFQSQIIVKFGQFPAT